MATFNNHQITVVKDNDSSVSLRRDDARALAGDFVNGHTRFRRRARPIGPRPSRSIARPQSGFAIAHNGNLTNTTALAEEAESSSRRCSRIRTSSPNYSRARSSRASHSPRRSVWCRAHRGRLLDGGARSGRDPRRARSPTAFGRCVLDASGARGARGWIVASESRRGCRGATFVREISPGEMVTSQNKEVSSIQLSIRRGQTEALHFEFVYSRGRNVPSGPPSTHDASPDGRCSRTSAGEPTS